MTHSRTLQIAPKSATPLTAEQKRFNRLIKQIDSARAKVAEWQQQTAVFRQSHHDLLGPLRASLIEVYRQTVLALDGAISQRSYTRKERELLKHILCGLAGELLDSDHGDATLRALFDKHNEVDWDTEKQEERMVMKEMTEMFTGVDLGDEPIGSEEELMERMHREFSAQQEAMELRHSRRKPKKRSAKQAAAQAKRDAEEKLIGQSVRDVYRKLVSALHPDREPDPLERERKTRLMAKINKAYEANDLLSLLEAQLQIEQLDAGQMATLSSDKLKHYISVLEEQQRRLRDEIEQLEMHFRIEFLSDPFVDLDPSRLGGLLKELEKDLRIELLEAQRRLADLNDPVAVKRWLKRERQQRREDDEMVDFPF